MNNNPTRLADDNTLPASLRSDMQTAINHRAIRYNASAAASRFEALISSQTTEKQPKNSTNGLLRHWKKLVIGLAVLLLCMGGALGYAQRARFSNQHRVAQPTRSVTQQENTAQITRHSTENLPAALPLPSHTENNVRAVRNGSTVRPPRSSVQSSTRIPNTRTPDRTAQIDTQIPVISEEQHLLRTREMLRQNPRQALAMVNEGHRIYQHGQYYALREPLAVLALSALGARQQARERARSFLQHFPRAHLANSIRSIAEE